MAKVFHLSQTDKKIAGVCGGLAEYFDIDSLLVRIGMLVLVFGYGCGLLLYIVLALLAPKGPMGPSRREQYKEDMNERLRGDNYNKG